MKIHQQNIERIRKAFDKMQTKEDLLNLLNYAKICLYSEKAILFEMKQVNYCTVRQSMNRKYRSFTVAKKGGGFRTIHAPTKGLKMLQACLNIILQSVFKPHRASFGFVPNKSIVDNAANHVGSEFIYNIDLKDFFPSIDQPRFWRCLHNPPFNLTGSRIKLASIIAAICCTEMDVERMDENGYLVKKKMNVLPQGAPTSPIITNIVCQRLDLLLSGVAKAFGMKYSRYADDITFSSMHDVYSKDTLIKNKNGNTFLQELHKIIKGQNFQIKETKTRLQKKGFRQEVTGLNVNQKVNVKKGYSKQIRKWIHLWEKLGYEEASKRILLEYANDRGNVKKNTPNIANMLSGKLQYLKMVRGADDTRYLLLNKRFTNLIHVLRQHENPKPVKEEKAVSLDNILEVLVTTKDLSTALNLLNR